MPCGAAAKKALDAAGVKVTPVTLEQDVKAALSKVKLGEVDAALVYRTDAMAASADVDGVEFPESAEAINDYPIAALKDAPNPAGAAAFVAYVQIRARADGARRRGIPEALSRRPPLALALPAFVGLAFLVLPLAGLLIRAPWSTLPQRLDRARVSWPRCGCRC